MSRLDRHVAMVQNKLALGRFVGALAWASVFWIVAVEIGIIIDRLFRVRPIGARWWIWGGLAGCAVVAMVYALIKRPTQHDAAVAIDDKLALKEKFSTALYARPLSDPFAQAAVKDAERTADNVSLHKRFPLEFPLQSLGTVVIAILVAMTLAFLPKMDLFGKEEKRNLLVNEQRKVDEAKKAVERALAVVVQTEAKGVADEETIKQAKRDLEPLINAPIKDPEKAKRSAARALSDLDQALKDKIANNQRIADVESDAKAFKSLMPPSDEKGPVAEAQRSIAKGDFTQAVEDVAKAVDKFDKMDDEEKKKAAEQMQKMAQQLQQMAQQNPQQQQQMQQQLQNMGLNQQQAQQAAQQMQQAAQGDKKAQQNLQNLAQQAMNQMAKQNPAQAQQMQQQVQQMMKQMQAQANTQQQAQQMAQAAQQMAQAMQQAQQQQGQQGQKQGQQQGQQQANAQQQQQGQQQGQKQGQQGQQPGQQQGQQQGQQAGQQGGQQQQQQMAQAAQAMQQQLQAMQAMKADAQQVAAAQAAAAQAAQDAANGMNNGGQGGQGQQQNGQWQNGGNNQGNNQGKWNNQQQAGKAGPNAGGQGAGDRTYKEQAPYQIKEEVSQSKDIEGGKILASTLIKAKTMRGESKVGESTVGPPPAQEAADEVEQERISRPAQQAVKEYFSAWEKDSGATAPPVNPAVTPAPAPAK